MQEMVELSKTYSPQMETMQQAVSFTDKNMKLTVIPAGPAHFGRILRLAIDKVNKIYILCLCWISVLVCCLFIVLFLFSQ